MSDTVIVALIGIASSILTSLIATVPQIRAQKKATIDKLEETDKEIKTSISKINDKVDRLSTDFKSYKIEDEDWKADQIRVRMLRFDDDLCDKSKRYPSESNFNQARKDVDTYEEHVLRRREGNITYHNGIGEDAAKRIRETYNYCKENNKFGELK